jgi:hypothetical protein
VGRSRSVGADHRAPPAHRPRPPLRWMPAAPHPRCDRRPGAGLAPGPQRPHGLQGPRGHASAAVGSDRHPRLSGADDADDRRLPLSM